MTFAEDLETILKAGTWTRVIDTPYIVILRNKNIRAIATKGIALQDGNITPEVASNGRIIYKRQLGIISIVATSAERLANLTADLEDIIVAAKDNAIIRTITPFRTLNKYKNIINVERIAYS